MKNQYKVAWLVIIIGLSILFMVPSHVDAGIFKSDKDLYIYSVRYAKKDMVDIVKALREAQKGDMITIYINSPGGTIVQLMQLLNAIHDSKATVKTIADGAAYSAGSILALSGDLVNVKPYSTFMFHLGNNGYEVLPLSHPLQREVVRMLEVYAGHILTVNEKIRILNGKDVHISGQIIYKRLKNPIKTVSFKDIIEGKLK